MKHMDKESIATAATKVTYGGAGGAVFFGMTANEFAAIGGLCIACVGLVIQIVFKVLGYLEMKRHHSNIEGKAK